VASQFLFLFPGLHTKENFLQGVGIDGQLKGLGLELWCLTTLSTILQLYRGGQFNCLNGPGGRRDRMVVGFITTCAISAYHH
jgi:hypothetical protein